MRARRRPPAATAAVVAAAVVAAILLAGGAAADPPMQAPAPDPGAGFELLCRGLSEGDNAYFGRRVEGELTARLARLPEADSLSAVLLRTRLGFERIRLGRHEQAIDELERALASIDRAGLRSDGGIAIKILSTLAMAHFQLAEDENCIARHHPTSCILPIGREAVHRQSEHTRAAAALYRRLVDARPESATWRWLLSLSHMLAGDYPRAVPERFRLAEGKLAVSDPSPPWRDVAAAAGIHVFDHGGGAVTDDFDGDGLLDLISSSWDPCESLRAFRNRGDGSFEDVTSAWGLAGQLGAINLEQADYDGDGDLDLLALRGAWLGAEGRIRNSLLENDLNGERRRFVDVTSAAGLASPSYPSHSGAWADYDADGDLDLFIGNETAASSIDPLSISGLRGEDYPSQLFRNNGDRTFTDVAASAGVANLGYAKGVAWGDYDNDGDADLYVSNIGVNRLYRNGGDGTFTDVAAALGVTAPKDGSFATWFFDYDNDGDLDLFVARYSMRPEEIFAGYFATDRAGGQPHLYRNDPDGGAGRRFTEVSTSLGLDAPSLTMGANFGDLDNDGWLDIYLGTGVPDYEAMMPNLMYRNVEGGGFADVTFAGGFGQLQKGHGIAFADLDGDGDQDLYQQLGGAFPYDAYGNALYENPTTGASWITLRLESDSDNRFAVGARIEVVARGPGGRRSIHRLVGSGGSFGASSLQAEIGLGSATEIERVEIVWPATRRRQTFAGVEPNRVYRAVEGRPELIPVTPRRFALAPADAASERR